jgi:hypothetical protein
MTNEENAKIELKHIQIELINNRARHMRHFIDQYFCYKNGYVTRTGRAKWADIFWNERVSVMARKETLKKNVVKEHVIPLHCITQELVAQFQSNVMSLEEIAHFLDEKIIFATITKQEDKRLRDAKLNSSMPEGYKQQGHPLYQDSFARYKVAGIELE